MNEFILNILKDGQLTMDNSLTRLSEEKKMKLGVNLPRTCLTKHFH